MTIPSASAAALFSDSSTKLIQNPQMRSVRWAKSIAKIGEEYPIATGSFQPGIGGVGINPLVNTQFTYTDIGVIIDVTPNIHPDGDVSMHIHMEVSSVISQATIGGITQPIIGTKTDDAIISLRDGEVSLLGGMFDDQQTRAISGIPGLGQIPILKYLFSQTQTDHMEDEVVFVLIPHVVRKIELDDLNQKAISVGTATSIQLSQVAPLQLPAPQAPATQAALLQRSPRNSLRQQCQCRPQPLLSLHLMHRRTRHRQASPSIPRTLLLKPDRPL